MLWNYIYEFFIKYVFGGYWDGTGYFALLGDVFAYDSGVYDDQFAAGTNEITFFSFTSINDPNYVYHLTLGNYLSLIATIITIIAILLFCVFIVKKIIAIIFRLFSGSSVF